MYTRVLQGHIAISTTIFPSGTSGCLLDSFARRSLWKVGKSFNHGTGHGVGAALNVHEGPQRISPLLDNISLNMNMIISNEPGYYENNHFGIRIENLLLVQKVNELESYNGREFYKFESLTLIPIQIKMIKLELLTLDEREYINNYHQIVREQILTLPRVYPRVNLSKIQSPCY
jgi:Xaa-Pro aminopeptidase